MVDEEEAAIFTKDQVLEEAAQKGFANSMKANSPLEKRWKRWLMNHKDEMLKYDGMDRLHKQARRLEWIGEIYDNYTEERKKAEIERQVFKVNGAMAEPGCHDFMRWRASQPTGGRRRREHHQGLHPEGQGLSQDEQAQ